MNTATSITSRSMTFGRARRVTLATLLCVLGTAPTWAATTSITVSFRDLDLSSIAGATTLYHRIQSAAKQVCGYAPGITLIERAAWQACYRDATADAVRKVNNPLLTAVHAGRKPEMTAMLSK
jgi:UrcA family protein